VRLLFIFYSFYYFRLMWLSNTLKRVIMAFKFVGTTFVRKKCFDRVRRTIRDQTETRSLTIRRQTLRQTKRGVRLGTEKNSSARKREARTDRTRVWYVRIKATRVGSHTRVYYDDGRAVRLDRHEGSVAAKTRPDGAEAYYTRVLVPASQRLTRKIVIGKENT